MNLSLDLLNNFGGTLDTLDGKLVLNVKNYAIPTDYE